MYGWVWRQLPGPLWMRLVTAFVLVAIVVVILFAWVFPWVEPRLPFVDVTVEDSASAAGQNSRQRSAPADSNCTTIVSP